ncbi:unnamed protein product [Amaranthus hypochondriacus]
MADINDPREPRLPITITKRNPGGKTMAESSKEPKNKKKLEDPDHNAGELVPPGSEEPQEPLSLPKSIEEKQDKDKKKQKGKEITISGDHEEKQPEIDW